MRLEHGVTPHNKSAILIDLASLQATVASSGVRIDFERLRDQLAEKSSLVRATAYGIDHEDQPLPSLDSSALSRAGYKVVTKQLRRRDDGTLHASIHVEMTVDSLDLAPHVNRISLVTNDPDFVPLIEALQRRGVRVQIVVRPDARNQRLVTAADEVLRLDEILRHVALRGSPRHDHSASTPTRAAPRETARARVPDRPHEDTKPPALRVSHPRTSVPAPPEPPAVPVATPKLPTSDTRPVRDGLATLPEERLSGRAARPADHKR